MDKSSALRLVRGSALFALAIATGSLGAAPDPQYASLERLRAASSVPVTVHFEHGIPRALRFDVAGQGEDNVARARALIASHADLFLQGDPRTNGGPDATAASELQVRSVGRVGDNDLIQFSQTLGGFPVFGANLAILATPAGRLLSAGGVLVPPKRFALAPAITREQAETIARGLVGDAGAAIFGTTHLMVHDPLIAGDPSDPRLVWSVVAADYQTTQFLIDALDGSLRLKNPIAYSGGGVLSDYDLYLQDANGENIMNTTCFNPSVADSYVGDESGIIPEYQHDPEAANLWWHWQNTYLFFKGIFGRESYDNDGEEIESYIYAGPGAPSTPGGPPRIYGARYIATCGFEFMPGWVSFDVAVHEFAHGVIHYSSGLVYQDQSGALNESFADVMGAIADPNDWLVAEDRTSGLGAIRSVADPLNGNCGLPSNPTPCGDPDRLSDYCFTQAGCSFFTDNGGVHSNSGIPNKAHYLMAEGGTHYGIPVQGMGVDKMAQLAYHVFLTLPPNATFLDARLFGQTYALSWATQGTFGFTLDDVCTVTNAWGAVEVGPTDLDCDLVMDGTVDTDGDGHFDEADNCPLTPNVIQWDFDGDGSGDACDEDADGDSCPDAIDNCPGLAIPCTGVYLGSPDGDGDGLGDACDTDDDNDGIPDTRDNCQWHANPDQFDGNGDGNGDACDPDLDGDGFYADTDNCPFLANPDQADSDDDGLGDACDDCPDTADNTLAYTPGNPTLGLDPEPYQPDSDGDGIPDACDGHAFDTLKLEFDDLPFNPARPLRRGDVDRRAFLQGPAGADLAIPLAVCDTEDPWLGPGQRVELVTTGLPESVPVTIVDQIGTRVAQLSPAIDDTRGLWFTPDCRNRYSLTAVLEDALADGVRFTVHVRDTEQGEPFPWGSPGAGNPAPTPIADSDGDLQPDAIDNCPMVVNGDQSDSDGDGFGDACDRCDDNDPAPCEVFFHDSFEFRPPDR